MVPVPLPGPAVDVELTSGYGAVVLVSGASGIESEAGLVPVNANDAPVVDNGGPFLVEELETLAGKVNEKEGLKGVGMMPIPDEKPAPETTVVVTTVPTVIVVDDAFHKGNGAEGPVLEALLETLVVSDKVTVVPLTRVMVVKFDGGKGVGKVWL